MRASTSEAKALDYIIALIYERTRIRLHAGKQQLIRSRLGQRLRVRGSTSLAEYCDYLQHEADEAEFTHVVDALTTNFTSFLREPEHFEFMVERALPAVLFAGQRRFKVWSAGGATGEEPYSIAFYLAEHFPLAQGWDWRILASDVSSRALAEARAGIYPWERMHSVRREWLRRYCQRGSGDYEGQVRIKPELGARVEFRPLNLLGQYSFAAPFELIYCRNVMIYFDHPTRMQLVAELARHLVPGGYLLIGHAETLSGLKVPFQCEQPGCYRKR